MNEYLLVRLSKVLVGITRFLTALAGVVLYATAALSQSGLPLEVERDLTVAALERALTNDDYKEALRQIDRLRTIVPDETNGELLFFEAFAAFETESYKRAEEALRLFLVNPGNTSPRYNAGLQLMLDLKDMREQAIERATGPLRRSCESGNAGDCTKLGWRYHDGREGVPEDKKIAASYFRMGCEKGNEFGCTALGAMYRDGSGVGKNNYSAMTYFERGCDLGHGRGCGSVGHLYHNGIGISVDLTKAARYYRKGCAAGDTWSCEQLNLLPRKAIEITRAVSLPSNQCLIIVASRQNREDVNEFIGTMPIDMRPSIRLFQSSNGWFAISIGAISRDRAKERINREVAGNRIPGDSFCASPERFSREFLD